ncbi:hypothetical protein IGI04_019257 [Brassica rapa subsp. trilocularis]|uniref:Uncharacterized protein n=1 Tax=Brassica rapa subsp. trilocularis TaxID=1813537 RepID=A0ABQ7MFA6_BRACM|nr:hypothetical protein IGI04_019257 [Brassica rapa subsp. trilocularis]
MRCPDQRITEEKSQTPAGSSSSVDLDLFFVYHQVKGHNTKEWKKLQEALLAAFNSCNANFEPPKPRPKTTKAGARTKKTTPRRPKAEPHMENPSRTTKGLPLRTETT